MRLFDLHCDTATRLLGEKQGLYKNNFHIDLKRVEYLTEYAQVMAVWTNRSLSDEDGYSRFFEVLKNLDNEIAINSPIVERVASKEQLLSCVEVGKTPLILAVEDARILANNISRLDVLKSCGVKLLTLNWYGETCIGGGHDTTIGLTDFGVDVVKRCFDLGIVPDVSHCSFTGTKMTIDLAKEYNKPIIASHSDSYSVNPHVRNLKDENYIDICDLGGLIGINLCPSHLSADDTANISDIIKHIEHYLSLGGENSLAMGCDLDGTDLPEGFTGVEDMYKIVDAMQRLNYSNELIDKIMYRNAFDFFKRNL